MTIESYKTLREFADSHKISLSGFKKSDVDISVIKDAITTLSELQRDFPKVADDRHRLTLILSQNMAAEDFAITTKGRLIELNAAAYRDKKRLEAEYQKLVDERWFVEGSTYKTIMNHEFGHIVAAAYKIDPLETACEITGLNEKRTLQFIGENLSEYAASYDDGTEIISEVFSDMSTANPSEFSKKYYAKILERSKECS